MQIKSLEISYLRNLENFLIQPGPCLNLIYGQNGSGKTSILEAIYLLGMGRSFRTSLFRKIIQSGQPGFTVYAQLHQENQNSPITVGIQKGASGNKIRISNQDAAISDIATLLPLQLINYDSFDLLNAQAKMRRQFFDWGMFHVKHNFLSLWRQFNNVLLQRNKILQTQDRAQLASWNQLYVQYAEPIDFLRKEIFTIYQNYLNKLLLDFNLGDVELFYSRGWAENSVLADLLENNVQKDIMNGYTQYGPHRADIIFRINKQLAKDVLSRGQQKLLITILKIAQSLMLKQEINKQSIFLLDDLPAELDQNNLEKILMLMNSTEAQVFITTITPELIQRQFASVEYKMFHVKHGELIV